MEDGNKYIKKKQLHKISFEDNGRTKTFPVYILTEDEHSFKVIDLKGVEQTVGKRALVRLAPITTEAKYD